MKISDIKEDDYVFVVRKKIPSEWEDTWVDVMDAFVGHGPFLVRHISGNKVTLSTIPSTITISTGKAVDPNDKRFLIDYAFPSQSLEPLPLRE